MMASDAKKFSLDDGFTRVMPETPTGFVDGIYFSVAERGLRLSANAVRLLSPAKYAAVYLNEAEKVVAIQGQTEKSQGGFTISKYGKSENAMLNAKALVRKLTKTMRWNIDRYAYRVPGTFDEEQNAIFFELGDAEKEQKTNR